MFLPEGYDPKLSSILDAHTAAGLIPDRQAVNFLKIGDAFDTFFKGKNLNPKNIFDVGGRALPYLWGRKNLRVDYYEPRAGYGEAIAALHDGRAKPVKLKRGMNPDMYDAVLINLEAGGIAAFDVPADFNAGFVKGLPVIAYKIKIRDALDPARMAQFLGDGSFHETPAAQDFYKKISSHMHRGISRMETGCVEFFDLTRDY